MLFDFTWQNLSKNMTVSCCDFLYQIVFLYQTHPPSFHQIKDMKASKRTTDSNSYNIDSRRCFQQDAESLGQRQRPPRCIKNIIFWRWAWKLFMESNCWKINCRKYFLQALVFSKMLKAWICQDSRITYLTAIRIYIICRRKQG